MTDFLDEIIEESTRQHATFPQEVEAAFDQRLLMRELLPIPDCQSRERRRRRAAVDTCKNVRCPGQTPGMDSRRHHLMQSRHTPSPMSNTVERL